ncbi:DAZ-associated protein 1 [Taenia solium]|eukprot:TsM_001101900 transcript=TsM_001101900 gene=TsM_001101900
MASTDADLICGVCTKLLRNPYNLPCGHTFCLWPCLLPYAKAGTSRCIHCDATFDASWLSPNYAIGARLYLLSSQQRQEQKPKQQVEDNNECAEELPNDGKEISEKPRILIDCSTCRKAVEANMLEVCHHCHQNICPQCHEKHHENYRSTIRVKLNALFLRKEILKSRLVQLRESKHSLSEVEKKAKDELLCALEGAVMELRSSASKSLDSATAKLEMMEMADYEILNPLLRQITNLIAEVSKAQDVSASLEGITDMQELAAKQKSLRSLIFEAAPLEEMVKNLPPFTVTQINLSGLLSKVDQHMSSFSLFMGDSVMSLPQLSPLSDTGKQSGNNATLFVGGLQPSHTKSQLRQYFAQYGAVIGCHVLQDRETGESRGFGFVSFREAGDASRALANCPHFIEGDFVQVKPYIQKSRKEKKKTDKEKGMKSAIGKKKENKKQKVADSASAKKTSTSKGGEPGHQLVVHDLPNKTSKRQIRKLLGGFGAITKVKVDQAEHRAFVSFSTAEELQLAMNAAPHCLCDVDVRVSSPTNFDMSFRST